MQNEYDVAALVDALRGAVRLLEEVYRQDMEQSGDFSMLPYPELDAAREALAKAEAV